MKPFFITHIRMVVGVLVVLTIGGSVWYIVSNAVPTLGSYTVTRGTIVEALDEPATAVAEGNAELSFQEGGQIAHVYVKEGDAVNPGMTLADLNSASFNTNVKQAEAALAAAQAKLDALQTGATPQTIAVSETALASAQQSLANGYTGILNILNDAYAKANDAVRTQLNQFFNNGETANPTLSYNTSDFQAQINAQSARVTAANTLNEWSSELTNISQSSADRLALSQNELSYLTTIQPLLSNIEDTLNNGSDLGPSTLAAYKINVSTAVSEVNAAITELSNAQQAIISEEAAVSQAQANLNLTTASSTSQDIQEQQAAIAQAQAAATAAQIALNNTALTAPFPGTVQNLTAQVGQVVSPGAPVLSLINNSGLKIQAYVSEADVAKIAVGDTADVTLDAFGIGTIFPATITTIDSAETQINGAPSYLVTLHFTTIEPNVKDGMTGNVHIVLTKDDDVIAVPDRLVLSDGNYYFVLVKTSNGIERTPVTIGPVGDTGMTEITSGISEGTILANY